MLKVFVPKFVGAEHGHVGHGWASVAPLLMGNGLMPQAVRFRANGTKRNFFYQGKASFKKSGRFLCFVTESRLHIMRYIDVTEKSQRCSFRKVRKQMQMASGIELPSVGSRSCDVTLRRAPK